MELQFELQVERLLIEAKKMIPRITGGYQKVKKDNIKISEEFKEEFFRLVDKVNLSLMEDKDNFYGYFLFQMSREIRFDIGSPTAVNFKGANYVLYFNPILFLNLSLKQMENSLKHEILHIVSNHLIRAKEFKGIKSKVAVNMAMDLVVNQYLDYLPPYATTVEQVNIKYTLDLKPYRSFEYYLEKIQTAIDLQEVDKEKAEDRESNETMETEYSAEKTHDLWEESDDIDDKTLEDFTEMAVRKSEKGELPTFLKDMIAELKNNKGELPWNIYLNRLMGMLEGKKKKTITRRSRRQPDRLDIKGELRSHKANIAVAIDISGSIREEEYMQAMKEVLQMVKSYNNEITIIECDDEIRRVYKVKSVKDIKERLNHGGATKYDPVFEYANNNKINLLVYFTDGNGEDALKTIPRGYKTLWIISGDGDKLSLKEPYGVVKKLSYIESKINYLDSNDVERGGYSMNNQERNI
ncbi:MAG: hypothetical protein GX913_00565 [Clostridiales bacterium]|nr:hypothetical protein [Clostridiales bacterium]